MQNEPLFEIHQTKGNSEASPYLSPNDEFAEFEPFTSLIRLGPPPPSRAASTVKDWWKV